MTTATITGNDVRLRNTVVRQLDWDPQVDASEIGVTAREGVITLTGSIDSYAAKLAAERAVKRVRGVRAVANDLVVRLRVGRTDGDIARDAAQSLKLRPNLADTVQVSVHDKHVTLTGTVQWLYQRQEAEEAIRFIPGILGVFNHIAVKPVSAARDVRRRITRALHHSADLHARHVDANVKGDVVTLTGTVETWAEREAAEDAAGTAPGVAHVDNQITVVPPESYDSTAIDDVC
ncbi:MAG TPA: BON domain-containing protein [Vicinamibacterales bacterium]|nr:BON domain-containing protein [Vicinamibacterales bacterium]